MIIAKWNFTLNKEGKDDFDNLYDTVLVTKYFDSIAKSIVENRLSYKMLSPQFGQSFLPEVLDKRTISNHWI